MTLTFYSSEIHYSSPICSHFRIMRQGMAGTGSTLQKGNGVVSMGNLGWAPAVTAEQQRKLGNSSGARGATDLSSG